MSYGRSINQFYIDGLIIKTVAHFERTLFCVLGGEPPSEEWLKKTSSQFSACWAVDNGANICHLSHIAPDFAVGDMDSVSTAALEWCTAAGAQISRYPRKKDSSDFQLALALMAEREAGEERVGVFLTGALGGRLDHTMSNISSFLHYEKHLIPIGMADCKQGIVFLSKENAHVGLQFKKKPTALSVLPLSDHCSGVSLTGVEWPIEKENLSAKSIWTISNEVLFEPCNPHSGRIQASCEEGLLGIYWFW